LPASWNSAGRALRYGRQADSDPFAVVLALTLLAAELAAAQPYAVVELSTLPGTFRVSVSDINERLEIVGHCDDEAVLWDSSGVRPLGFAGRQILTINNRGVITGTRFVAGEPQLFEWVNGVFRRLPQPPGSLVGLVSRTENDILLVRTDVAMWAAVGDTMCNLSALTGAEVSGVTELGTIAGQLNGSPYLRFLDGRVVHPAVGVGATLQAIGSAGHFAGIYGGTFFRRFFSGAPDGTATDSGRAIRPAPALRRPRS